MEKIYGEKRIEIPTIEIPKLSKDEIIALYKRIKPMVTYYDVKHLLKEYTYDQIVNTSYLWNIPEDLRGIVDPYKLVEVEEFPCLHSCGFYGFFKPLIGEVLSQLPEKSKEEANIFEIVEEPKTSDDLNMYQELTDRHMQLSKVRTYRLYK